MGITNNFFVFKLRLDEIGPIKMFKPPHRYTSLFYNSEIPRFARPLIHSLWKIYSHIWDQLTKLRYFFSKTHFDYFGWRYCNDIYMIVLWFGLITFGHGLARMTLFLLSLWYFVALFGPSGSPATLCPPLCSPWKKFWCPQAGTLYCSQTSL